MKSFLFSMLLLMSTFNLSIAQSENKINRNNNNEWQLFMQKDGINVYYNFVNCQNVTENRLEEILILKFINTNKKSVSVVWDLKVWYDDNCQNCDVNYDPDRHFAVILKPGENKIGSCENLLKGREFSFFSRILNTKMTATLSKFEMQNFIVKPF